MVFIERLTVVVCHKDGRLQALEQGLFTDIGIGVVDEHAWVAVTVGIDVQVCLLYTSSSSLR